MKKTNIYAARSVFLLLNCLVSTSALRADPTLRIDVGQVTAKVSPTLYGLMTEEINYSYEGGLYGELIQNRIFRDDPNEAKHWSVVQDGGGTGSDLPRPKPAH